MKAIIKVSEEAGAVEVRDLPMPEPKPGEVLVKMGASGICYSDVMIYKGLYKGRTPLPFPLIMGHEGRRHGCGTGPGGHEPESRRQGQPASHLGLRPLRKLRGRIPEPVHRLDPPGDHPRRDVRRIPDGSGLHGLQGARFGLDDQRRLCRTDQPGGSHLRTSQTATGRDSGHRRPRRHRSLPCAGLQSGGCRERSS